MEVLQLDIFEEWKPIEGHKNYLISTNGRCISVERDFLMKNGAIYHRKRQLKVPHDNGNGYFTYLIDGKHRYIHRLVAQTFLPNPENKEEVDHIDGNKSNNRIENLRWVTRSENLRNPVTYSRMSEVQERKEIVVLDADGKYVCECIGIAVLCKKLGITTGGVKRCLQNKEKSKSIRGFQYLYKENYDKQKDYGLCLSHNMGYNYVLNDRIVVVYSDKKIINVLPSTYEAENYYGIPRKYIYDICAKHINICTKHAVNLPHHCYMRFYKDLSEQERNNVFDIYRKKYPIPNLL